MVLQVKEITPSRDVFEDAVSSRTYRLEELDNTYNSRVARRLSGQVTRLAITFGKEKFSGSTLVAILGFLRIFRNNAVPNGISEGAASFILLYFMDEPERHRYVTQMGLWLED